MMWKKYRSFLIIVLFLIFVSCSSGKDSLPVGHEGIITNIRVIKTGGGFMNPSTSGYEIALDTGLVFYYPDNIIRRGFVPHPRIGIKIRIIKLNTGWLNHGMRNGYQIIQ